MQSQPCANRVCRPISIAWEPLKNESCVGLFVLRLFWCVRVYSKDAMQTHKHEESGESDMAPVDGELKVTIPPRATLEEKTHSLDMHWYVSMFQLLSLLDTLRATGECTLSDVNTVLIMSLGCYVTRGISVDQREMDRVLVFADCICNLITGFNPRELFQICGPDLRNSDERIASKIIADHFAALRRTSLSQ